MTALWATVFITAVPMRILLTVPVWLRRAAKDKCWCVGLASMSFRRALGDLSFVFAALLGLSYTAAFFPTLAACITLG